MDLGHRRRRHGPGLEAGKQLCHRLAEALFDNGYGLLFGEGGYIVLELGQLIGNITGQQVAPGGQHLPQLDENRTQLLQGPAQAHAPGQVRRRVQAPGQQPQNHTGQGPQSPAIDKLVQPVATDRAINGDEAGYA